MPDVSVIVPNYNQTAYLIDAIQSLLSQTVLPSEIIIIDDGSTDGCYDVVSGYGGIVRYIFQNNKGLAGARNTGLIAAKSELIGLLDADDQWLPDYLEHMLIIERKYPDAVAYYCQAQCMDESGKDLPQILGGLAFQPKDLYWQILRANFIIPSTVLLRRAPVLAAGLFDQNLRSCEDWDLWLRLLPNFDVIGSHETLVRYRIHNSSLSANPRGMQDAVLSTIKKNFGPDDGQIQNWSAIKRRAYGGVYRYFLLSTIQRLDDWESGLINLAMALVRDPGLAMDIDLFYDLAWGKIPISQRVKLTELELYQNAQKIIDMLDKVFNDSGNTPIFCLKSKTYGTAYLAIGLLAYNLGVKAVSRNHLLNALKYRPDLWGNERATLSMVKSFIPNPLFNSLKNFYRRLQQK